MPDTDLTARLAPLLAEHRLTTPVQCLCGWRETDSEGETHPAHVAAVLAEAGVGFVGEVERERDEWAFDHSIVEHWRERAERAEADARRLAERLADCDR